MRKDYHYVGRTESRMNKGLCKAWKERSGQEAIEMNVIYEYYVLVYSSRKKMVYDYRYTYSCKTERERESEENTKA